MGTLRERKLEELKIGIFLIPAMLIGIAAIGTVVALGSILLVDTGIAEFLISALAAVMVCLLVPLILLLGLLALLGYLLFEHGLPWILPAMVACWIVGNLLRWWVGQWDDATEASGVRAFLAFWQSQVRFAAYLLSYGMPAGITLLLVVTLARAVF